MGTVLHGHSAKFLLRGNTPLCAPEVRCRQARSDSLQLRKGGLDHQRHILQFTLEGCSKMPKAKTLFLIRVVKG